MADVGLDSATRLVNSNSPFELRDQGSPPELCRARRAQCHESGLLCSTEACRTNPDMTNGCICNAVILVRVIPAFYPMPLRGFDRRVMIRVWNIPQSFENPTAEMKQGDAEEPDEGCHDLLTSSGRRSAKQVCCCFFRSNSESCPRDSALT